MRRHEDGPSALRYPRDDVPAGRDRPAPPFELGRANLLARGSDLAILAYGFPANHALEARERLAGEGYSVAVYDARFAKPVDVELLRGLIDGGLPVLTVEDHHTIGGFGACVLETCNEHRLPTDDVYRLGLPDRWIHQGSRSEQLAEAGIDAAAIARSARRVLDVRKSRARSGRRPVRSQRVLYPS